MIEHGGIILPSMARPLEFRLPLVACGAALACLLAGCAQEAALPTAPSIRSSLPAPTATPPAPSATPTPVPPTPIPTATPCAEPGGQVIQGTYPAVAVPGEVPLAVYLPPCYADQRRPLPVLYLLHGYPFDEGHWLALGAAQVADGLILSGLRLPFLMVMPRQPEPLFRSSDGGPGSYESELLDGLLPYVASTYPAATDQGSRGLAGISRGGVWALEIGFRHPETFSAVGALSPALAVNHARAPYDPFQIVQGGAELPEHLLLMAGDRDWAAVQTLRLSTLLNDQGWPHLWLQVPGEHAAATWEAGMLPVLEYLTEGWVLLP